MQDLTDTLTENSDSSTQRLQHRSGKSCLYACASTWHQRIEPRQSSYDHHIHDHLEPCGRKAPRQKDQRARLHQRLRSPGCTFIHEQDDNSDLDDDDDPLKMILMTVH